MNAHVPSDHILDEFLGKQGVRVSIREFSTLLAALREAFADEATHLTDDGAGSGEPAVAAGEAGSIPAGNPAPSSPHLEDLAVVIRRHTLFPADEVETRETCACGWRPTGNPMLAYSEHACHVRDALVASGFVGEGATPATTHRPTCGTTYGESCDGYCPTPAIDRKAIAVALHDADWHHQWGANNCQFFECQDVSLNRADVVLALLRGAS